MDRRNNIEFITELMEFSNNGAISQLVIMHAVEQYCKSVMAATKKPDNWNDMVSWETWQDECRNILQEMENFYASK